MGRGKSYLEEDHERKEESFCRSEKAKRGEMGCGFVPCERRSNRTASARLSDCSEAGKAGGNDAKQVLLQHQSADARGADAAQAIGRQTGGGTEGDRRDREGLRIPVQPLRYFAGGVGRMGGGGEQVLPVF